MVNSAAKKVKNSSSKPSSASSKDSSPTSRAGSAVPEVVPTPQSPGDSTLTVKEPLNAHAAKAFLHQHGHLDSSSEPITAGLCSNLLTSIATRADTPKLICALIRSVDLLLPGALKLVTDTSERLTAIENKVDKLISKSKEEPAAPPPPPALAELGEKLDKVSHDIQQATETWQTVPTRSRSREPTPPRHADPTPDPAPRQQPPTAPTGPSRADLTRQKRMKSQGCFILVEPSSQNLVGLSARALVQKAVLAWDAAWDEVKGKAFVKELGIAAKPRVDFKTAVLLTRGGVRYEMGDRTQAALLSDARIAVEFEKGFGGATCKGQGATILLQGASVDYKPEEPSAIPNFERENQLNPGDVLSMTWCKPIHKRRPGQLFAFLKLEMRSHDLADQLITCGGQLNCEHVNFSKARQEPMRCLRCQNYGHKLAKCFSSQVDICSRCGDRHKIADCQNKEKKWCIPCESDAHSSFDRACPTFRAECDKFNKRRPENASLLFGAPPASIHAPRPIYHPTPLVSELWPEGGFTSFAVAQNAAIREMERPLYQARGPAPRKQINLREAWNTGNVRTAPRVAAQATGSNSIRILTPRQPAAREVSPVPEPVLAVYYTPSAPAPVTPQQSAVRADTPATPLRPLSEITPVRIDIPTPGSDWEFPLTAATPSRRRNTVSSIASTSTITQ